MNNNRLPDPPGVQYASFLLPEQFLPGTDGWSDVNFIASMYDYLLYFSGYKW